MRAWEQSSTGRWEAVGESFSASCQRTYRHCFRGFENPRSSIISTQIFLFVESDIGNSRLIISGIRFVHPPTFPGDQILGSFSISMYPLYEPRRTAAAVSPVTCFLQRISKRGNGSRSYCRSCRHFADDRRMMAREDEKMESTPRN